MREAIGGREGMAAEGRLVHHARLVRFAAAALEKAGLPGGEAARA